MSFKRHPKFKDLRIKSDGSEFILYNEQLEIKDHKAKNGRILKVIYFNHSYYSVPKLILETYGPPKPDNRRYYALYKDGNIENLHPNNLFWSKSHVIPEKRKFKNSLNSSKLSKEQNYMAYRRFKIEGEKLGTIAEDFGVSDMAIHRAVKRYERYLASLKVNN